MHDVAIRDESTAERESGAWLVGFPIVALFVLMILVQSPLAFVASDTSATGVCRQTGSIEARFITMILH